MARAPVLLGVDAGTTNVKTVAFDADGTELASASREADLRRPAPGRVEQDTTATWEAVAATIEAVVADLPADAAPAGVGLTAQGDGCWPIDADGDPVGDAIVWSDSRAAGILEEWESTGRLDALVETCGSPPYPGMSLPILAWLAREEPDRFDRIATAFSCTDWLRYRLTGERATNASEATVPYLDRTTGEVDPDVFDVVDLPAAADLLPRVVDATEVVGTVTEEAAAETGLPEGLPVVGGLIDVAAAAIGSGAAAPGTGAVSLGTSLVTQTPIESPEVQRAGIQMALGVEGLWTYAIGSNAGTPSLDWLRETVFDGESFEELAGAAASVPVGSEGVVYHPYLSTTGERGPFVDPNARAQFLGLSPDHTDAHLARAVYEGLSLAVRDCAERLPVALDTVQVSGGGARSAFWCQLLADCLDATVVVPEGSEFGARGAAIVLGLATGTYPDLATAVDRTVTPAERYDPREGPAAAYDDLFDLYREIREGMGDLWAARAETDDGRRSPIFADEATDDEEGAFDELFE